MTHPADPADPIVLDSSVMVRYERMKTPGAYLLNETQSRLVEWLADRTPLMMPALSLSIAAHECGGQLPELDYLMQGDPDLVLVVRSPGSPPSTSAPMPAVCVARTSRSPRSSGAPAGHDDPAASSRWPVATYWPDWYAHAGVPVIAL